MRRFLFGVALLALAFGCYARALHGPLLYDDLNAIVVNQLVSDLDVAGIFTTPSWWWGGQGHVAAYRPLTTLTFAVQYALSGTEPFGYHLVNALLHGAVCLTLAVLLGRLTDNPRLGWLAGLLFAAHPVHTEAVASVVGRAEEMAALFALGAWLLVLEGRRRAGPQASWVAAGAVVLL